MFRGIYPQRNFPIHHNNFNHHALRDLLLNHHKGGFILSYNDCSVIREWYSSCKIVEVAWQYTMGQGETRIGLNRINSNRNHIKFSHEIIISKYDSNRSDL
jgi:DNA adenine methylase